MAYCPECGSEIGEVEGFCPYCGISLQPIAVSNDTDDDGDEFIHEVVEDSTEFSKEAASEISTPSGTEKSETGEDSPDLSMSETVMVDPRDFAAEISDLDTENNKSVTESEHEQQEFIESIGKEAEKADNFEDDEIDAVQIESLPDEKIEEASETDENDSEQKNVEVELSEIDKSTERNIPEGLDDNKHQPEESEKETETVNSEEIKNESISTNDTEFEAESDDLLEIDVDEKESNVEIESADENKDLINEDLSVPDDDEEENNESESVNAEQTDEENASTDYNFDDEAQTIIKGSNELNISQIEENQAEKAAEDQEEAVSSTTPNINAADTGGKSSKLKPLEEGTVLNDRYEIVRKIGGGGMGAVYLASDKNLGGVLRAVKEMVQSYIEEEQQEKAIKDFKRESMLLTSLEHSSIPTIYDYFFDEKEARFYLVMKYISGGDLAARLKSAPEGRLDEKSVVEWGIQIADVLSYLHNRQPPIVYRDLKPANVMIDGNTDRVMLIDFGIARWINKEEKGVTAVGTMGYAPPELFSGNVEPRSDVYSLGSTMFHLLTGADPQSNPLLIFDFQKHPRPRQINPNLSDQIERILMRSVEYNSDKRFETAAQMRDALQRHLEKLNSGQVSYGIKQTPKPVGLENQPVFCGFCGQKIVASDMFCAFCGAKQPLAQPGVHSQEYIQIKQTARLMIDATGELDAPTFLLEKTENLVGRRDPLSNIFPEVDLSKYDPQTKISRKHARIWRDADNYLVEDLGSSNGTLLISQMKDPVRLEPNKSQVLTDGDRIKLGDTTLQFIVQ